MMNEIYENKRQEHKNRSSLFENSVEAFHYLLQNQMFQTLEKVMDKTIYSYKQSNSRNNKNISCKDWIGSRVTSVFRMIIILINDVYHLSNDTVPNKSITKYPRIQLKQVTNSLYTGVIFCNYELSKQ